MLTARGALAAAHAGTRLPGSSTACVLRLNRLQRTVDAANLVRAAAEPQHSLARLPMQAVPRSRGDTLHQHCIPVTVRATWWADHVHAGIIKWIDGLRSSGLLQGDSGFMLVREGKVVYRSPVLQHFFDCPLQFGAVPDFSESTDTAEDAAVAELQVQPGDVLLAGSDGLWDNCFDAELLRLLPEQPAGAQQVHAEHCASLRALRQL